MTLIIIVLLGSLIVGLLGNIFLHERIMAITNRQGLDPYYIYPQTNNVFGPTATLLALFIAFVLFGASGSYSQAKTAAQTEAAVVQAFYRTADYLPDARALPLQRAAICYARTISGPEWDLMRSGRNELAPEAQRWVGAGPESVRTVLQKLGPDDDLFSSLLSSDQARGDARRERLTQADPTIPGVVSAFMLFSITLTIVFLAMISPRKSVSHIAASILASITLVAALFLIYNLDRPFRGPLALDPVQMQITEEGIAAEFDARYGSNQLGCDARGRPT